MSQAETQSRVIQAGERLRGEKIFLRLVTQEDCTAEYVGWMRDPEVNRFLETRWTDHSIASVREHVEKLSQDAASYLFAICAAESGKHVGNIKIGPVHKHHNYADVSYFIGDRAAWGKGFATEAIMLATGFGFSRMGLNRVQAGIYGSNAASGRALEKAGYTREGTMRGKLSSGEAWEDHIFYGILRNEWEARQPK